MTLKDKIGRLLIIGFKGDSVNEASPVVRAIKDYKLGGVILFDRLLAEKSHRNNIIDSRQTRKLIADLQNYADGELIVSVDQEGGLVNRFKKERGFPQTAKPAELAATADTSATRAAGEQTAAMLSELGFTLNLAPVVDLNSYPENPIIGRYGRSFSAKPEEVIAHALAWIEEHHKKGLHCCLKHFPGHGSARSDSHLGFVDVSKHWQREELTPFTEIIRRGMADCVMTGHLFNTALDPDYPATLSPLVINGLLRDTIGYRGPVLSDDMQMQAITAHYGLEECVIRALNSGVDLLVFGNNMVYDPDITEQVVHIIVTAVADGRLSEERIETAWRRVETLRKSSANNN